MYATSSLQLRLVTCDSNVFHMKLTFHQSSLRCFISGQVYHYQWTEQ